MQALRKLTSLGTCHQVPLRLDDRDSMLLDRCGTTVATQSDIPHYNLSHINIMEL